MIIVIALRRDATQSLAQHMEAPRASARESNSFDFHVLRQEFIPPRLTPRWKMCKDWKFDLERFQRIGCLYFGGKS